MEETTSNKLALPKLHYNNYDNYMLHYNQVKTRAIHKNIAQTKIHQHIVVVNKINQSYLRNDLQNFRPKVKTRTVSIY